MANSGYGERMDIIPTIVILLAVTLILQGFVIRNLNRQVNNLSSRLHHAEVNISRLNADISAQEHYVQVISNDLRDVEQVLDELPVKE